MTALQEIWDEMGFNVDLVLPYQYKTKGEVLIGCKNQSLMRSLIMGTTSCGKYTRHGYRHCGVCIPCLVRRAFFMKAHMSDRTEGGYCIENLKATTSRDVAAAALGVAQYEKYGIDGSQRFRDSLDIQTVFLKEALMEAEKDLGHIISIHSRGATKQVLSAIERTKNNSKHVLHWFMGSLKEVEWAIGLGCWFSVNPKMCESKQGQNIINNLPQNRILPETDAPFVTFKNRPYYPWDETVPKYIAEINNISLDSVRAMFNDNLRELERKSRQGGQTS